MLLFFAGGYESIDPLTCERKKESQEKVNKGNTRKEMVKKIKTKGNPKIRLKV